MADEDWEKLGGGKPRAVVADKWDGEDEEENVKENWDDDDDEEAGAGAGTPSPPPQAAVAAPKKKKNLDKKIAERDRLDEEARLAKLNLSKSPEEIAAEKLRMEKLKAAAEIKVIQDAFGSTEVNSVDPQTKDDFDELRKRLVNDLTRFEKRELFGDFLEDLIQDLCLFLPSRELKKVKTSVEALYFQKNKTEKAATAKPSAKAAGSKGKIKLNVEGDRDVLNPSYKEDYDELEDFM